MRRVFTDIHELGAWAGFDLDFRQLSAGPRRVSTSIVRGQAGAVLDFQLASGFHQRGIAPAEMLAIGVPRSGVSRWAGRSYRHKGLLPFNLPSGLDAVSQGDFAASVVLLSRAFLREVAEHNALSLPAVLERPQSGDLIGDSSANARLRACLQQLLASSHTFMDDEACYVLALCLLEAAQPEPERPGCKAGRRSVALHRALELIEART